MFMDRGPRTNCIYERGLTAERGPLRTALICPHSSISPRSSMLLVIGPRSSLLFGAKSFVAPTKPQAPASGRNRAVCPRRAWP